MTLPEDTGFNFQMEMALSQIGDRLYLTGVVIVAHKPSGQMSTVMEKQT